MTAHLSKPDLGGGLTLTPAAATEMLDICTEDFNLLAGEVMITSSLQKPRSCVIVAVTASFHNTPHLLRVEITDAMRTEKGDVQIAEERADTINRLADMLGVAVNPPRPRNRLVPQDTDIADKDGVAVNKDETVREQVETVVDALTVLGAAPVALLFLSTGRERRQEGVEVDIPAVRVVYHGDSFHGLPERIVVAVVKDGDMPGLSAVFPDTADDGLRKLRGVVVDDDNISHIQ